MIIEHRTYQLRTSAVDAYLQAFGQTGFDLQCRHYGRCVGHYVTETGSHSRIVALWEHETFERRQEARRELYREAQWTDIIARVSPMIVGIDATIMTRSPLWQPSAST